MGVVDSLSFDVQGAGGISSISGPFGQTENRGGGSAKIRHFLWMS